MKNRYLTNPEDALELVSKMISINKNNTVLNSLEKFIRKDFLEFIKEDAPPDNTILYGNMIYEYERLFEYVSYQRLSNKTVIGVGGSFSSGKSTFLNSLLGKKILPSKITPTTSIPTYIVNSNKEKIVGINLYSNIIDLNEDALKALTHNFNETYGIWLSNILKSVSIELPEQNFENIAFLDTPGYTKAEVEEYHSNTDENLSRVQLNTCNYIIWVIDVESGTVKEEDIKFLKSLDRKIPKLVVINKADKKTEVESEQVKKSSEENLLGKGVIVEDVVLYSSRKNNEEYKKNILKYLKKWNVANKENSFYQNNKSIFEEYKKYYIDKLNLEKVRLTRLNKSLVYIEDSELESIIKTIHRDVSYSINRYKERLDQLEAIEVEFFKKLENIMNIVGLEVSKTKRTNEISDIFKYNSLDSSNKLLINLGK